MSHNAPLAVFDSGVGGLSVLRHVLEQLPNENILYVADQANVPYGSHSLSQITQFCHGITDFLLTQQVKLNVVACNTASAAALTYLRRQFPNLPFVGMEPAVKPAVLATRSRVVGVMATQGTFASERYASLVARFGQDVQVVEDPCLGLVELIEAGHLDTAELRTLLSKIVKPMQEAGVDTVVLGCTHYPFIRPLLQSIVGPDVTIINPAPAVALQTVRMLKRYHLEASSGEKGVVRFVTTGDAEALRRPVSTLLGLDIVVETAVWQDGGVLLKTAPQSSDTAV